MSIDSVTPYLNLRGRADEAIDLYRDALGAEIQFLERFGDAMPNCPEELKSKVMHAVLQLGKATIFLSDGAPDDAPNPGGTVSVALAWKDEAKARPAFDALGEGGTVQQPLLDAPWGALFGALQDRFGINWMFSVEKS